MSRFRGGTVVCLGAIISCGISFGQQGSAADASSILTQASAALGSAGVSGVVLHGTAIYTAGSDEEGGPAELESSGYFDSKVLLHMNNGDRLEILHHDSGVWAGSDAARHPLAAHNAMISAPWFFPALIVNGWVTDQKFSVSSLGTEQRDGASVLHLRCVRAPQGEADAATTAVIQRASAMDLFLDSTTCLAVALEFNTHPDNNALQDIPVRIEYGDYRAEGATKAPYRIQKYLQGTLLLDIAVSSVAVNPVIPSTEFSLQ